MLLESFQEDHWEGANVGASKGPTRLTVRSYEHQLSSSQLQTRRLERLCTQGQGCSHTSLSARNSEKRQLCLEGFRTKGYDKSTCYVQGMRDSKWDMGDRLSCRERVLLCYRDAVYHYSFNRAAVLDERYNIQLFRLRGMIWRPKHKKGRGKDHEQSTDDLWTSGFFPASLRSYLESMHVVLSYEKDLLAVPRF